MSDNTEHTNRLIDETSPYLLQHAHNPVDWYPWGPEALERARREDRLILLSIGYSACHWCHVMERESFENEDIATLMNRDYVNVKVDREERPDLDEIYMDATLALNNGQGGWPMTVFLTPELEPVFAGTYYPPKDQWGRPGFATLLERLAAAWREEREALLNQASQLVEHLKRQKVAESPLAVGEDELRRALRQYEQEFDAEDGGFGPAPKFPPAAGLSLLLRLHRRFGDENALAMVTKTLDAMAQGGIYDQVGGGFARYSTDEKWLVPHFEKMLYDNALLVSAYLEGYQVTGEGFYRRIVTETLDYILREMQGPEGGIYSATDADSEGVEGKFFVWTPEEIAAILDADEARAFGALYDIQEGGNWEGKSIPWTPRPMDEVADELGLTSEELWAVIEPARAKVYEARLERVPPGLDDKVLTAWNGMMILALAQGYDVLGERRYLEAARRAAAFVMTTLRRDDGGLYRTWREGKAHLDAYLEDYAWMCEALLGLYETGGDKEHLEQAEALAERILADFHDTEKGGFFNTSHTHEKLILRYRDGTDGATPAGNAVAASALARLAAHLSRNDFHDAAVQAIRAHGRTMTRYPRAFAKSLSVVDFLLEGPVELAFIGKDGADDLEALRRAVAEHYLPNRIQALADPEAAAAESAPPLVRGKAAKGGKAALYVCRDFTCRAPVTDASEVASALEGRDLGRPSTSLMTERVGQATAAGTERYAARHQNRGFKAFGSTGLQVSRLGFGAYRVGDVDRHRKALQLALAKGVNLIDTSTNYTDGASERMIGSVLGELIDGDEIARDEVVVVSKIGYIQGHNYELAREREESGRPFPEVVKVGDGLWHAIHPEFLADQLGRSLERLELDCLDVCLLHNPEYFLTDAGQRGESLEPTRREFYRRLEEAFRYLESQVEEGRIGAYGVSSNTVGAPVSAADATSLADMLEAARKAAGEDHHFRVLQLPLNLFETGPLLEYNTGQPLVPALELAQRRRLAVLVNRPLNAFNGSELLRLAEVEVEGEELDVDAQIRLLGELEAEFRDGVAVHLRPPDGELDEENDPANAFRWSEQLAALPPQLNSLDQWRQIAGQIAYLVNSTATSFDRIPQGDVRERWVSFRERYFPELDRLLDEIKRQLSVVAKARSSAISAAIDPHLPPESRGDQGDLTLSPSGEKGGRTLSKKALWTLTSTPGVNVVLVGMRQPSYVEDAVDVLGWDDLGSAETVYQAVKGVRFQS